MQHGFIKVAAAVPEIRVADPSFNASAVRALLEQAHAQGVKVAVFPELCLTGYTCGDLFLQRTLLDAAQQALREVTLASMGLDTLAIVGLPLAVGGSVYNVAAVVCDGCVLGVVPKKYLPNDGVYAEGRYFSPSPEAPISLRLDGRSVPFGPGLLFAHAACPELVVGVEICEDLFAPVQPSAELAMRGATVICNPAASNELVGKAAQRRDLVRTQSGRLKCAYLFCSAGQGESTQDGVFSGHSLICENGRDLSELQWQTGLLTAQIDVQRLLAARRLTDYFRASDETHRISWGGAITQAELVRPISPTPFVPLDAAERALRCQNILRLQAEGLRKRIAHTNAKKLVIGVSGGLDSTLALLVAAQALDLLGRSRTDILAVTMPCFGTTERTRSNAEILSERLGAEFLTVDIRAAVEQHFHDIGHDPCVTDVTYENAQARERTQVLMDLANKYGGMVIGTGDLSELALGWATYNGDHMSMYGVNASVPKTLIRHIVGVYADSCSDDALAAVLRDVLDTPVSPELLPPSDGEIAQKTEDLVGPYELHDFFLYYTLRWGFTPGKIFRMAVCAFAGRFEEKVILHWLSTFCRRFFAQQFKRSCLPDGPGVGSVSLSPRGGWVMSSDASYQAWMAELSELHDR